MVALSVDLRRRLVAACRSHRGWTHATMASLFGVDEATVKEVLHRYEETGDVLYKSTGGNKRRTVDREWLARHLADHPDARLIDRIRAWTARSGKPVSLGAMWLAVRGCGWAYRDGRWFPETEVASRSRPRLKRSSQT
jgi:transposase